MEIWKEIQGYNYSINESGCIKNSKGQIIKPWILRQGYLQVALVRFGVRTKYLVHRLVAEAFLENPKSEDFVNHKNLIKNDNRVENLEWVSKKENIAHFLLHAKPKRTLYSESFKIEVANFQGGMLESTRFYNLPTSTVQRWRKEFRT